MWLVTIVAGASQCQYHGVLMCTVQVCQSVSVPWCVDVYCAGVPAKRQCLDNSQADDGSDPCKQDPTDRRSSSDGPTQAIEPALEDSGNSRAKPQPQSFISGGDHESDNKETADVKQAATSAVPGDTMPAAAREDGDAQSSAVHSSVQSSQSGERAAAEKKPMSGVDPVLLCTANSDMVTMSAAAEDSFTSSAAATVAMDSQPSITAAGSFISTASASASVEPTTSADSASSSSSSKRPATRVEGREKPTIVDIIIKNMDTIFGLVRHAKDT